MTTPGPEQTVGLFDEDGEYIGPWIAITCEERENLMIAMRLEEKCGGREIRVAYALTDPAGQFGLPRIFTEWCADGVSFLRDKRHPGRPGALDTKPCEHHIPDVPGGEWTPVQPEEASSDLA